MSRARSKWFFRVLVGLPSLLCILALLAINHLHMTPDRMIALQKKDIADECKLEEGDAIYMEDFLWDSEYYVEYSTGNFRLVAVRSLLGTLLCFSLVGCLTPPKYTAECYKSR